MAPKHPVHAAYHDKEYGFPTSDERILFERLCLEIMQAGLSWEIVLKKRAALNDAFDGFQVDCVAKYKLKDVERLLSDERIIRNRLKIEAIIVNAGTVLSMRDTHGGFAGWLDSNHPQNREKWIRTFRSTFKFMGKEIVGEFLMSIGLMPGAHVPSCRIYGEIQKLRRVAVQRK